MQVLNVIREELIFPKNEKDKMKSTSFDNGMNKGFVCHIIISVAWTSHIGCLDNEESQSWISGCEQPVNPAKTLVIQQHHWHWSTTTKNRNGIEITDCTCFLEPVTTTVGSLGPLWPSQVTQWQSGNCNLITVLEETGEKILIFFPPQKTFSNKFKP